MIDGLAHPLEALLDARLIVRVPASRPIDYASGYWAQIEAERRQQLSDQLLPYWLHIAGAYEAALNSPVSGDNVRTATVAFMSENQTGGADND